jgi:hypothetical protein
MANLPGETAKRTAAPTSRQGSRRRSVDRRAASTRPRGVVAVEQTDGATNKEQETDIRNI